LAKYTNDDSFRSLAAAIVIRAVRDYRVADECLNERESHDKKVELTRFFNSDWAEQLCEPSGVDPKMILFDLQKGGRN
jgi:hypothetical protein